MKGTPPTTLTVIRVVTADKPNMMLRPKLSGRLLSRPRKRALERDLQNHVNKCTFKVLPEPIEKSTSRNRVMEANVGEKNSFQKP